MGGGARGAPQTTTPPGARVVIVNGEPTAMDRFADAVLLGPLGDLLPAILTL